MRVLIIESRRPLAELWKRHIERQSVEVVVATSAMAVADYACYRRPNARVIYVTSTTFFSDGSVFAHMPNACGYVQTSTEPDDLAAMVEHLGAG